ncbi:MAG TPA: hypothetical protein VFW44_10550 [Bryobacteraceae bacterium]|nr:hypothetical protein [Bryobacteraceae bacterium]
MDLALLVLAGLLAWQLRREWTGAQVRNLALVRSTLPAARVPGMPRLDSVSPVSAADFADVAMKNLFSADRNPNVIVEPLKPVAPKPVPPFPVAHGVMLWEGVPPTIVLSEKANGPQKGYHPGDTIGQWKLVSLDKSYVSFEWDGKEFKKRIDELIDRNATAEAAQQPVAAAAAAQPAQQKQTQSLSSASTNNGPGVDLGGGGFRGCQQGDTSPSGTVVEGMKKVITATPFGQNCHWEKAQ